MMDKWFSELVYLKEGKYTRAQLFEAAGRGAVAAIDTGPPRAADSPPIGPPSIQHVLDLMKWINKNPLRTKKVIEELFTAGKGGAPKLAKSIQGAASVIGKMPISDVSRWLTQVMVDKVTAKSWHMAFAEIDPRPLVNELTEWGLTMDGIENASPAMDAALAHSFMMDIINGTREDDAPSKPPPPDSPQSAASMMKAIKAAYDALSEPARLKMAEAVDTRPEETMLVPLGRCMEKTRDQFELLAKLVDGEFVTRRCIASCFRGKWLPMYNSLVSCLEVRGPRPPWIEK